MGPRPRQRLCKVVFIVVVIAFLSLVYFIKGPLDLEGGSYTSAWVVVPECLSVASVMWRTAATTQQTASTWWNAKEADWRKLSFQPVPEQNEHTHTHTHTHTHVPACDAVQHRTYFERRNSIKKQRCSTWYLYLYSYLELLYLTTCRPHRARMSDKLLSQFIFLKCNRVAV